MAAKKPTIRKTMPTKKLATASKLATTAASAGTKERKPRKPAVERAEKLATLLTKKYTALQKMVIKWHGEATPEQQTATIRLAANLGLLTAPISEIAADVAFLLDSGFTPSGGSPGRKPLAVGTKVKIKEAKYDPEIHGEMNDFTVFRTTDKFIIIKDDDGLPVGVIRAWLEVVGTAPAAEGEDAGEDTGEDVAGE
jgi:hypothetical protein